MALKKLATALRKAGRQLRGKEVPYRFVRERLGTDEPARQMKQALNLLNYAKTSGSAYDANRFPAGYHTLSLNGASIAGQRNPESRLRDVPYDFTGKTVLDIGCNQGGMLFALNDRIRHGVGIDFDRRLINAANRIRSVKRCDHLDFYVFDLEQDDLSLLEDILPDGRADIVFLLSVCMWIDNWKAVIDSAKLLSDAMLFESNGKQAQQQEQLAYLRSVYGTVELLNDSSEDDSLQKRRKLYLCR